MTRTSKPDGWTRDFLIVYFGGRWKLRLTTKLSRSRRSRRGCSQHWSLERRRRTEMRPQLGQKKKRARGRKRRGRRRCISSRCSSEHRKELNCIGHSLVRLAPHVAQVDSVAVDNNVEDGRH